MAICLLLIWELIFLFSFIAQYYSLFDFASLFKSLSVQPSVDYRNDYLLKLSDCLCGGISKLLLVEPENFSKNLTHDNLIIIDVMLREVKMCSLMTYCLNVIK